MTCRWQITPEVSTSAERGPQRHVSLRDYPDSLKPRERLQAVGPEALSNTELLAILLSTGTREQTALDLAQEMLRQLPMGELSQLGHQSLQQLARTRGLGLAKAARIQAAIELGKRVSLADAQQHAILSNPESVFRLLQPQLSHLEQEHFLVLFADSKNRWLGQKMISKGLLNATLVHPRDIFREALRYNAHAILVAHNHPSGDPLPSPEDLETTRRLVRCGTLMQIELLDHVIVGRQRYTSLREQESWLWKHHDVLE